MRFRASDNPEIIDHARERWRSRSCGPGEEPPYSVDVAWRRARDRPVNWGLWNAMYVRYDSQTDCLLLALNHHSGSKATLYLLTVKRAEWELGRAAVRKTIREAMEEDDDALRRSGFEVSQSGPEPEGVPA